MKRHRLVVCTQFAIRCKKRFFAYNWQSCAYNPHGLLVFVNYKTVIIDILKIWTKKYRAFETKSSRSTSGYGSAYIHFFTYTAADGLIHMPWNDWFFSSYRAHTFFKTRPKKLHCTPLALTCFFYINISRNASYFCNQHLHDKCK